MGVWRQWESGKALIITVVPGPVLPPGIKLHQCCYAETSITTIEQVTLIAIVWGTCITAVRHMTSIAAQSVMTAFTMPYWILHLKKTSLYCNGHLIAYWILSLLIADFNSSCDCELIWWLLYEMWGEKQHKTKACILSTLHALAITNWIKNNRISRFLWMKNFQTVGCYSRNNLQSWSILLQLCYSSSKVCVCAYIGSEFLASLNI